jgi:1-deoxy-D-xylulose 5-phosphate reductoisomerase
MKEKPSVATAMAAADDAAVESFLGGKIRFMQIARVIEETMAFTEPFEPAGIKGYVEWAKEAYKIASSIAEKLSKSGQ